MDTLKATILCALFAISIPFLFPFLDNSEDTLDTTTIFIPLSSVTAVVTTEGSTVFGSGSVYSSISYAVCYTSESGKISNILVPASSVDVYKSDIKESSYAAVKIGFSPADTAKCDHTKLNPNDLKELNDSYISLSGVHELVQLTEFEGKAKSSTGKAILYLSEKDMDNVLSVKQVTPNTK